jgi:hypothetical protein
MTIIGYEKYFGWTLGSSIQMLFQYNGKNPDSPKDSTFATRNTRNNLHYRHPVTLHANLACGIILSSN